MLAAEKYMTSAEVEPSLPGGYASHGSSGQKHGTFEGDYELTSQALGDGMNGTVRLAIDRRTGKKVAVKSFDMENMDDTMLDDLKREIALQTSLDHPNIAKMLIAYHSGSKIHLVLEYLKGGDMFERFEHSVPPAESEVACIVAQLLDALEFLHAMNMVHRDIKLENVMYVTGDASQIKLIDFGLARSWEGPRKMSRFCGTPGYRAPEVSSGAYTNAVDMWSLGVLTHAVLTGDMIGSYADGTPRFSERFAELSPEARDFLEALINIDPNARLTASQASAHPWMVKHFALFLKSESCMSGSTRCPSPCESETDDSVLQTRAKRAKSSFNCISNKVRDVLGAALCGKTSKLGSPGNDMRVKAARSSSAASVVGPPMWCNVVEGNAMACKNPARRSSLVSLGFSGLKKKVAPLLARSPARWS